MITKCIYYLKINELQSTSKLFEHLKYVASKNSYLMQFCEINIHQVMIFRLYTVYNKHDMIKMTVKNQIKIASIIANDRIILLPTVIQSPQAGVYFFNQLLIKNSSV